MLLANNLSFSRNKNILFKELNISLSPSKIIHIKGHNGVGKTTLIKILANILLPDTGEIYWNGKNIKKNLKIFFENLTYIMDIQTSKKEMTVQENLKFWMKLFSSKISNKELDSILNLLYLDKNSKIGLLSKGEVKKLELTRLVLEKKKFWLLDEPYADLDFSSIELINETFKNHIENEGMIIFSSHYIPELKNMETIEIQNYASF